MDGHPLILLKHGGPSRKKASLYGKVAQIYFALRGSFLLCAQQPATPCRSARPHTGPGAGRCRRLFLLFAVERRLSEKSTCRLQDFIGPAQLFDLTLERFDAFLLCLREDRKSTRLNSSHVKISYA